MVLFKRKTHPKPLSFEERGKPKAGERLKIWTFTHTHTLDT
jgi:hypothetical protein